MFKFNFVQWRRNSGIVEAIAEHDSRPKRFVGMVCTTEFEQNIFPSWCPSPNISPSKKGEIGRASCRERV